MEEEERINGETTEMVVDNEEIVEDNKELEEDNKELEEDNNLVWRDCGWGQGGRGQAARFDGWWWWWNILGRMEVEMSGLWGLEEECSGLVWEQSVGAWLGSGRRCSVAVG